MSEAKAIRTDWRKGWFNGTDVVHNGRTAQVTGAPSDEVPEGEVPIIYDDNGCYATVPAEELKERFPSPRPRLTR